MKKKLKIFVISIGYVPEIIPSDKKFIRDIVHNLSSKIDFIVWSLNDSPNKYNLLVNTFKNYSYTYYCKNRLFHKNINEKYIPHPYHSNVRNGIEINLSILWYLFNDIKNIINNHNPDIIHLSDSIGPVVYILKSLYKNIPITTTKPTTSLSNNLLYKIWVYLGLKNVNKIFTFTNKSKLQLIKLGIIKDKVEVCPWGIDVNIKKISEKKIKQIRTRYKCKNNQKLITIIPRHTGKNLILHIQYMKKILNKFNSKFIFAIRPTRYNTFLKNYQTEKIIIESGPSDFYDLLESSDFAISIEDYNSSTSLLPMTMMDAMLRKTPVITNFIPGIEDLIEQKKNGLIFLNENNFLESLKDIEKNNVKNLQDQAKMKIIKYNDIKLISDKYHTSWLNLLS